MVPSRPTQRGSGPCSKKDQRDIESTSGGEIWRLNAEFTETTLQIGSTGPELLCCFWLKKVSLLIH